MGNLLKGLFENRGDVLSNQVVEVSQQYGVDDTNLSRLFDSFALSNNEDGNENRERTNVLIVQPSKDGSDDPAIYRQYVRMTEDLYNNTQWDYLLCSSVEDAADQLSKRASKVENLVYLHHGGQWGFKPVETLDGTRAKELIEKRNKFLIDRIIKGSNNNSMTEEEASLNLRIELLDKNYEEAFVLKQKEYTDSPNWKAFVKVFFGMENLLKYVKIGGNFIDASCNQGSNFDPQKKVHTSYDSLKSLSFEKINIFVNTNETIVGIESTLRADSIAQKRKITLVDIGNVMNSWISDNFKDDRGWIKFDAFTKEDIITRKDIVLYSFKKPCFELITWIDKEDSARKKLIENRTSWFSKKYRAWRREDIRKWFLDTYKSEPTRDNLDKWFEYYTKQNKIDAKL